MLTNIIGVSGPSSSKIERKDFPKVGDFSAFSI